MANRARVLMISNQYPITIGRKPVIGGGGAHVFYLSRALAQTNQVSVVLLTHHRAHPGTEQANFLIEPVNFFWKRRELIRRACDLVARHELNVIHGHHYDGGLLGKEIATRTNLPFVLTMHKPPRLTKVRCDYHLSDTDQARWREFATNPSVKANIAYSETYLAELRRLEAKNTHLIYHGVPVEELQYKAQELEWRDSCLGKSIPQKHKLVLCPMRPEKPGFETFILAAAIVKREFPDVTFIATADTRQSADPRKARVRRLIQMSRCLGLDEQSMRFVEFPLRRMWALIRRADIAVLSSLREGLSIVLLESMALGTPIVAFDAPGIEEAIVHEESGILCEPGKEEHLAQAILRLLRSDDLGQRLSSNALVRVRSRFHARDMALNYTRLYEQLINAPAQENGQNGLSGSSS